MYKLIRQRASSPYTAPSGVFDSLCVGRGKQNDLATTDRLVSSSHARFFVGEGKLYLVDLDSRNGTEVNKLRLTPYEPLLLSAGDLVDFAGRLSFRVTTSNDSSFPVLSVEEPNESKSNGTIQRLLDLPEGLTPVLDPARLLALHRLTKKLLNDKLMSQGRQWLDELAKGVARLLKVPEVHIARLEEGHPQPIHPTSTETSLHRESVQECLRRGRTISVDVANLAALDLDSTSGTIDAAQSGPPFIPTLCGPILLNEKAWGILFASGEGAKRPSFDEQDIWLLSAVCDLVEKLFPKVSQAQILDDYSTKHKHNTEAATRYSLVGPSIPLGATLEICADAVRKGGPIFTIADHGAQPRRWAELAHQLSARAGAPFSSISFRHGVQTARELSPILRKTEGGTLFLEGIESLTPTQQHLLKQTLDKEEAQRVHLFSTSTHTPQQLTRLLGFDGQLIAYLSQHVMRIPALIERPEDFIPTLLSLAREAEPNHHQHFSLSAIHVLQEYAPPGTLTELEHWLISLLKDTVMRPITPEQLHPYLKGLHRTRMRQSGTFDLGGFHPLRIEELSKPAMSPLVQSLMKAGLL